MGRRPNPLCTALGFPSLKTVSQILVFFARFFEVLAKVDQPPIFFSREEREDTRREKEMKGFFIIFFAFLRVLRGSSLFFTGFEFLFEVVHVLFVL